jgi:hypothetical protein
MNSRGAKKRCELCNCASHTMQRCNSNMNGRRAFLDKGWNCMMWAKCPDFGLLRANELRYVAYHFVQYEKSVRFMPQKTTQHYNQKFRLRPIPLSLSKKQMVHALVQRWNGFQSVRDLSKNTPNVDGDDCPICLEDVASYKWCYVTASWTEECVTTECKHRFCTTCWNHHTKNNNHVYCPMCRHLIVV